MPIHFNTTNLMIVIAGTLILAFGLYRMFPLRVNRPFLIMNGPLAIMLIVGFGILAWRHNATSFLKWGEKAAILGGTFLPLMVLLTLVMAIGGIITGIHETAIQSFLLKHRVVGPFVAAFITPTSNALIPVVESAWKSRDLQPMCLFYLLASVQVSMPLFALRQIGFPPGSDVPGKMYAMGVVVTILMLVLMHPAFWLAEKLCSCSGSAWSSVQASVRALF
jgi:hypothetical protein